MPDMPASPVADMFGIVLQNLYPGRTQVGTGGPLHFGETSDFLVVSYRRDFNGLWSIDTAFLQWLTSGPRTIVLVWEETPTGELGDVALNEYVTAFDWAIALCLLAHQHVDSATVQPRKWRLLIADLASKKHPSASGVRLYSALQQRDRPLVPWIRSFSAADLETLLQTARTAAEEHVSGVDVDLLRTTWAAILVNPASARDRHAIVNLVGPRILLSGMQADAETHWDWPPQLVAALQSLMNAVGLTPQAEDRLPGPWIEPRRWEPFIDQFLLVDDMADLGWRSFLAQALGTRENQMEVRTDPSDWENFRDKERAILFLDLRLFTRRPDDEFIFFQKLLDEASKFHIQDDAPPESGFCARDLEAMQRVLDSHVVESPDYYTALTFLPRLLSLRNPTLPIVIFSSTGRREIAEALRPFGNIVLGFDKPRFFGAKSETVVAETRQKFRVAVEDALLLAEGRDLCRSLRAAIRPRPEIRNGHAGRVVEIFLDESGSDNGRTFAVGGFLLVHPPGANPASLDDKLRERGLVWAESLNASPDASSFPKYPNDYGVHLERLQSFFTEYGCEALAFGLTQPVRHQGLPATSLLLREGSLDLRNLDMITDALEALLFDVIDAAAPTPSSIHVHLATRTPPLEPNLKPMKAVEDWGISLAWSRGKVKGHYSVGFQDGRQITRAALRRRFSRSVTFPVSQARAVRLGKAPKRDSPKPREIHYMADWVARFASWPYDDIPNIAKSWFGQGFLNEYGEAFLYWLNAARNGDEEQWVDALHSAYQARHFDKRIENQPLHYSRFVLRKAVDWPAKVGSDEFRDLCLRIRAEPGFTAVRVYGIPDMTGTRDAKELLKSELDNMFKQFGAVSAVQFRTTSNGIRYALVEMENEASAGNAIRIARSTGLALRDQVLRVVPQVSWTPRHV